MDKGLSYKGISWSVSNNTTYLILFIIWPFLTFLIALANYAQKDARKIVYLFIVYYGFTFVAEFQYMDAFRYAEDFRFNATLPFSEIFRIIGGFYSSESSLDIIEPLISFVLSRFTQDYHFLFAAYAILFGFLYLRSANLLYKRYQENPDRNAWIFMLFFLLIIPPTMISVPRMWIAALMFFYGAYHVIVYRKTQYLLLALGACAMHWSFITVNLVLIAYYFAGNRNFIYTPIAIASFIVPNILEPILSSIAPFMGSAVESRYEGYTSQSYSETVLDITENASWFMHLQTNLLFYYFIIAIIIIRFLKRDYVRGKVEENWYSFLLLMIAFVNFGRPLLEFGSRMQTVFILFAAVYVFFYYMNLSWGRLRPLALIGIFPLILHAFILFRTGSETINAWILTPGVGLPLLDPTMSIAELLFH